uniref:hypothetical protein n=1 Tax=Nonomuraea sp. CA-251285 TaxID=3240002 RepID=UPI003F4909F7
MDTEPAIPLRERVARKLAFKRHQPTRDHPSPSALISFWRGALTDDERAAFLTQADEFIAMVCEEYGVEPEPPAARSGRQPRTRR